MRSGAGYWQRHETAVDTRCGGSGVPLGWSAEEQRLGRPVSVRPITPRREGTGVESVSRHLNRGDTGAMMTSDKVALLAAGGESETVEFKATTGQRNEAARTLSAMLNGRGGQVLFGV